MHGIYAMHHASCMSLCNHSHSMLKFLLSFYYLQCLYSVAPRRQTNNQQLSWSLGWPGQCSLCPLQHMFQLFYLSKASLVLHPLSFSLLVCCILSYVSKQFLKHQPTHLVHPGAGPTGHRTHHTTQHASQVTCHSQTLATCFILFLYM